MTDEIEFLQTDYDALTPAEKRIYHLGERDAYRFIARYAAIHRDKANDDAEIRGPR